MSSRSRRGVYDNWEKLVEATLKRQLLHELAFCPSFSSSSSIGSSSFHSSALSDDSPFEWDAASSSSSSSLLSLSSSQEVVVAGSSSSTGAIRAGQFVARLAAPAIALAHYITRKPTHKQIEPRSIKRFSFRELQVASNNFSSGYIIGYGRHGNVYGGRLADGSFVALKRLEGEELQFKTEVQIASITEHPNLLRLLGICITPTERMLVYPYMPTVSSILRERSASQPPLDWSKRKPIAVGTARGLAYMHDQCDLKIIHRDVKVLNIFLDEDFGAVIGCFGLALFMDHNDTHVTKTLRGTFGHIAPEYVTTGECSDRTDVYGYGVMLLELITGQRAFNLAHLANDDMIFDGVKQLFMEKKFETLVDTELQGNYIIEEVELLIQVALLCTRGSPSKRPKMCEVVRMLEGDNLALAKRWEEWQNEAILRQPNTDQIISNSVSDYNDTDYSSDIEQEEFSEPR